MAESLWLGIVISGSPEKAMEVISLRTHSPISSPEIEAPYTSEEEQERLLGLYQYLHSRAHNASRPLKTIYYTGPNENLLAWVRWPWDGLGFIRILGRGPEGYLTSMTTLCPLLQVTGAFELYMCYSPLGTKASAVSAIHKLMRWIRKEEDRLFILTPLTY